MLVHAGIAMALAIAPVLAFAAYNDVTLTTSAVLNVNGIELDVSGSSSSVIESIVVNPTSFTVTMQANSTFQVTAPGRQQLSTNNTDNETGSVCNDSQSILGYAAPAAETVIITPASTLCSTPPVQYSAGGGGGGSSATPATPARP